MILKHIHFTDIQFSFLYAMAVGTRCADHATPLYPQKSALLRRQRRSLGRIVRLRTKGHGVYMQ
jgi:hypothetical protein